MGTIILIGINHKSTSLTQREKILPEELLQTLYTAYFPKNLNEFFILSTCNRIEVVYLTNNPEETNIKILNLFKNLNPYMYQDQDAVRHFYEVVTGLDSMFLGESEILSQVRKTYISSHQMKTIGPILHQLLKESIRTGKRARSDTKISTGITSVAHAAVVSAKKNIPNFPECNILLIGAGTIAERVMRHLKQENIQQILVANRTYKKAQLFAKHYGAKAIQLYDLERSLTGIDVVISCTASPEIVISTATIKKLMKKRPSQALYLIDLAVPRDIEASAATIENVFLVNINTLQTLVNGNFQKRKEEIKRVEKIIHEEVDIFLRWCSQRESVPLLTNLQHQSAAIRTAELDRVFNKLAYLQLNDYDKRIITLLAMRLEKKFLARAIRNIKRFSLEQNSAQYLDTIKELFEL